MIRAVSLTWSRYKAKTIASTAPCLSMAFSFFFLRWPSGKDKIIYF